MEVVAAGAEHSSGKGYSGRERAAMAGTGEKDPRAEGSSSKAKKFDTSFKKAVGGSLKLKGVEFKGFSNDEQIE